MESVGQGTTRRLSNLGIYHVALISRLVDGLDIQLEPASALAIKLLAARDDAVWVFGELELRFDRAAFLNAIDSRISEAVESVVLPRRGRPRGQTR